MKDFSAVMWHPSWKIKHMGSFEWHGIGFEEGRLVNCTLVQFWFPKLYKILLMLLLPQIKKS